MNEEELLLISKRQLKRLKEIHNILEKNNAWEPVQKFMLKLNQVLRELDSGNQQLAILSFSEILSSNLLRKGCNFDDIQFIQKMVETNWLNLLKQPIPIEIDLKSIFTDLIISWER
jgi:hypothetical protein